MSTATPLFGSSARRCVPALLGLALFATLAMIYLAGFTRAYASLLHAMGANFADTPFMDVQAELAAMECFRRGFDVFVSNPCDVLGRPFNYSPIWLLGAHLHVGPSATLRLGLALDLLFLTSLVLLPVARTWRGTVVVVAATLSNAVFVALEQANVDLLMFILLLLAGIAALRPLPTRFAAYPLVVFAGLLKFYPMVAMIIALRERPTRFLLAAVFALLSFALFAYAEGADIVRALHLVPSGYYLYMFGAKTLPYGLQSLYPRVYSMQPLSPLAIQALLSVLAVGLAIAIARSRQVADAVAQLSESERVFLLLGSVILVGCFFAGQSFRYRAVFFLFVLPAMTTLWFSQPGEPVARLFAISGGGIVFLMWGYYLVRPIEMVAASLPDSNLLGPLITGVFWLGRELVWWWVISVLLAMTFLVVARCEMVRTVVNRVVRARD